MMAAMAEERAIDNFSYAEADDPWPKRLAIRLVERLTGQPYLFWLYEQYRSHPVAGENFWDAAIRLLELKVVCDESPLVTWPRTGPLVVVANHPFGVLDGLTACYLTAKVRLDFRALTNAVICRAKEVRPYLLPIDFTESKEARKTNLRSRDAAREHLMGGGCLIIFPAGGVSTTPTIWDKQAVDSEWKTFAAKMISEARAPTASIFFAGQNSPLFQLASHVSLTLRLALLFKEAHDQIGSEVRARISEAVPYEKLAAITDRRTLMRHLRKMTYALGEGLEAPPKPCVRRPLRAPKPGVRFPLPPGPV
jgi:putative hemolysin